MVIDTVILKASYDLMTEKDALAYSIRKLADDVSHGRKLQTIKLTRFIDEAGWDFLKFNFPVCGNLSSADLMVMYCALGGFRTYVVGNEERARRDAVIRRTLKLTNIHSVRELEIPISVIGPEEASRQLCFVNTQMRGFSALPEAKRSELVMEMAADQPLLYNPFRHALDLSVPETEFAINLNAVSLMQKKVPAFIRNGYDKVVNSRGEEVVIKENNNFAQTMESVEHNAPLFRMVYNRRNGGKYFSVPHLIREFGIDNALEVLASVFMRFPQLALVGPEMKEYAAQRKQLGRAASYYALRTVFNTVLSPSAIRDLVHVDATNDDIFSCWDMDGLNNDYLGYLDLFRDNQLCLSRIMPYEEQVYQVDRAIAKHAKRDGLMTEAAFEQKYDALVNKIISRLKDRDYLRSIGIDDATIEKIDVSDLERNLKEMRPQEEGMVLDLEHHLATQCLGEFERDRILYLDTKEREETRKRLFD